MNYKLLIIQFTKLCPVTTVILKYVIYKKNG